MCHFDCSSGSQRSVVQTEKLWKSISQWPLHQGHTLSSSSSGHTQLWWLQCQLLWSKNHSSVLCLYSCLAAPGTKVLQGLTAKSHQCTFLPSLASLKSGFRKKLLSSPPAFLAETHRVSFQRPTGLCWLLCKLPPSIRSLWSEPAQQRWSHLACNGQQGRGTSLDYCFQQQTGKKIPVGEYSGRKWDEYILLRPLSCPHAFLVWARGVRALEYNLKP